MNEVVIPALFVAIRYGCHIMQAADRPSLRDLTEDLLKGVEEFENALRQKLEAQSRGFPAEPDNQEIIPLIPRLSRPSAGQEKR